MSMASQETFASLCAAVGSCYHQRYQNSEGMTVSLTLRTACLPDMPAIEALTDRVFRKNGGHVADDFPCLFNRANIRHWYVASDDALLVGVAGAVTWPILFQGTPILAASLGSVATDPRYRGRHIALQLLSYAESRLQAEGVRLVQLPGSGSLYTQFGAAAVGRVSWHHIHPGKPPNANLDIRVVDPDVDADTVVKLYQSKSTRYRRSLDDLRSMLKTPRFTVADEPETYRALLVSVNAQPRAYLIVHHQGPVHAVAEWAGDPHAMLTAAACLASQHHTVMRVPVLLQDHALAGALAADTLTEPEPFPWTAKIIDGVGLAQDLASQWQELSDVVVRIDAVATDQYQVSAFGQRWPVSAGELTQWIFGFTDNRPELLSRVWPMPLPWPEGLNGLGRGVARDQLAQSS